MFSAQKKDTVISIPQTVASPSMGFDEHFKIGARGSPDMWNEKFESMTQDSTPSKDSNT